MKLCGEPSQQARKLRIEPAQQARWQALKLRCHQRRAEPCGRPQPSQRAEPSQPSATPAASRTFAARAELRAKEDTNLRSKVMSHLSSYINLIVMPPSVAFARIENTFS